LAVAFASHVLGAGLHTDPANLAVDRVPVFVCHDGAWCVRSRRMFLDALQDDPDAGPDDDGFVAMLQDEHPEETFLVAVTPPMDASVPFLLAPPPYDERQAEAERN